MTLKTISGSKLKSKKTAVAPFPAEEIGMIGVALRQMSPDALDVCRKARIKAAYSSKRTPGIYNFALQYFRKGTWSAIPTDKDGGFALVPRECLRADLLDLLRSGDYHPRRASGSLVEDTIADYIAI